MSSLNEALTRKDFEFRLAEPGDIDNGLLDLAISLRREDPLSKHLGLGKNEDELRPVLQYFLSYGIEHKNCVVAIDPAASGGGKLVSFLLGYGYDDDLDFIKDSRAEALTAKKPNMRPPRRLLEELELAAKEKIHADPQYKSAMLWGLGGTLADYRRRGVHKALVLHAATFPEYKQRNYSHVAYFPQNAAVLHESLTIGREPAKVVARVNPETWEDPDPFWAEQGFGQKPFAGCGVSEMTLVLHKIPYDEIDQVLAA